VLRPQADDSRRKASTEILRRMPSRHESLRVDSTPRVHPRCNLHELRTGPAHLSDHFTDFLDLVSGPYPSIPSARAPPTWTTPYGEFPTSPTPKIESPDRPCHLPAAPRPGKLEPAGPLPVRHGRAAKGTPLFHARPLAQEQANPLSWAGLEANEMTAHVHSRISNFPFELNWII
jgi:hypothetical protein